MNRAQQAKLLHGPGCFLVLVGVIVLTVLAFTTNGAYVLGTVALFVVYIALLRLSAERDAKLYSAAFNKAFTEFRKTKPTLTTGSSYGFPCFTITFQSAGDMNEAEAGGFVTAFKMSISELCRHCGGKKNPYDVERAVHATYDGRRYI